MSASVCTSYSIPISASTITPLHQFQPDIQSFLVGTNSLHETNRIYQLEYTESSNHLSEKYIYSHPNEILDLATNPSYPDKIITVSRPIESGLNDEHIGTLWQLPTPTDEDDHTELSLVKLAQFQDISSLFPLPLSYSTLVDKKAQSSNTGVGLNNVTLPDYTNILQPLSTSTQWVNFATQQLGANQPFPTPQINLNTIRSKPQLQSPLQRIIWQPPSTTNPTTTTPSQPISTSVKTAMINNSDHQLDPTVAIDTAQLTGQPKSAPNSSFTSSNQVQNYCLAQYPHGVGLYDLNSITDNNARLISSTKQQFNSPIQHVCWNRHKVGEHFYAATTHHIHGIDTRTMKDSFVIPFPHGDHRISSIDSNFIKQYTIITAGEDGVVSVWDIRRPTTPLLSTRIFTHAVSTCQYNLYHDNLIFAAGLDSTVALFSLSSVGSMPDSGNNINPVFGGGAISSLGMNKMGGIGNNSALQSKERIQLDATQLFPRVEPPYLYSGNDNTHNSHKRRNNNNRDDLDEDGNIGNEQKQTIQEAYERDDYTPHHFAVAPANRSLGERSLGDCLMSYHREHLTPVMSGCWSASSPWHYATLSSDGTMILNQVSPESNQYDMLL